MISTVSVSLHSSYRIGFSHNDSSTRTVLYSKLRSTVALLEISPGGDHAHHTPMSHHKNYFATKTIPEIMTSGTHNTMTNSCSLSPGAPQPITLQSSLSLASPLHFDPTFPFASDAHVPPLLRPGKVRPSHLSRQELQDILTAALAIIDDELGSDFPDYQDSLASN
jgi:hypothetical protein